MITRIILRLSAGLAVAIVAATPAVAVEMSCEQVVATLNNLIQRTEQLDTSVKGRAACLLVKDLQRDSQATARLIEDSAVRCGVTRSEIRQLGNVVSNRTVAQICG
jgi:hypothetical protein